MHLFSNGFQQLSMGYDFILSYCVLRNNAYFRVELCPFMLKKIKALGNFHAVMLAFKPLQDAKVKSIFSGQYLY